MIVDGDRCVGKPLKLSAECPEDYIVTWTVEEGAEYATLSATQGETIEVVINTPKVPVIITYDCCPQSSGAF